MIPALITLTIASALAAAIVMAACIVSGRISREEERNEETM